MSREINTVKVVCTSVGPCNAECMLGGKSSFLGSTTMVVGV